MRKIVQQEGSTVLKRLKLPRRLAVVLAGGALAVTGLAAPAMASAAAPARPAAVTMAGLRMVHATPLYVRQVGTTAAPLIGAIFFELKSDFSECLVGEGAGNQVKTSTTTCSSFNIQYPNPLNCGSPVDFISAGNNYALRAKNDGTVVLSSESGVPNDPNAAWNPANPSGSTSQWTNCALGGGSFLAAANDAVNSGVYARSKSGDWRFISNQT